MKEYDLGKEGEQKARMILKGMGFEVQCPDWIALKDDKWTCFEIKSKERFLAPPFDGHGLDKRQIYLRNRLLEGTGIRTYLLIFEVGTNLVFGEYLDILESKEKFNTLNNITIYPLANFQCL